MGGGGGIEKREREKKNERERKDREAQRESNGFTLELFELDIKHKGPYMTFEVKHHIMKKKCLYYVIIHTKFG